MSGAETGASFATPVSISGLNPDRGIEDRYSSPDRFAIYF